MSLTIILLLIWIHFVADFIFQTDKQAVNKSNSNYWLGQHVLCYSLFLIGFGWKFALVNGLLHFITDYISSRTTSYLWKQQKRHLFFVVIGLDQAIHMSCLFITYTLLVSNG